MATHGKLVIYRMTNATDTEDTVGTDKVEFDGDAQVPDGRSGIVSFSPVLSRTQTTNSAPFLELARKPDTGFEGIRYTINALFDESDGGTAKAIAKLKEWITNENALPKIFREGRFGIRNDYRPEFDLLPDNTIGYKLVHFETSQELLYNTFVRAVIVLELSGDI